MAKKKTISKVVCVQNLDFFKTFVNLELHVQRAHIYSEKQLKDIKILLTI